MLLPDQVLPFFQHDDGDVRAFAADYFAEAHDPSPATQEDFWRSVDRFGLPESLRSFTRVWRLPQTNASLDRLLQSIRSSEDRETLWSLCTAVESVDFPLLEARREELLSEPSIPRALRHHMRERLELAAVPPRELWERLARLSDRAGLAPLSNPLKRLSTRLIEALARHGEAAADLAMDKLDAAPGEDWLEVFAVRVAGAMRHSPALDLLLRRLIPDDDVLPEEAADALARIGTVEVVQRLESFYPAGDWHVRLWARLPLGRIKRPESEQALLRLLAKEQDAELATWLASDLLDLCTTEGLEAVRGIIVEDRYDSSMVDLPVKLLTAGRIVGYEPPEARKWRAELERTRKRLQKLERRLEGLQQVRDALRGTLLRKRGAWRDPDRENDVAAIPTGPQWSDYDQPAAPLADPVTIRRDTPRVGRNDPCPCGSGKKYKKCCLTAAQA